MAAVEGATSTSVNNCAASQNFRHDFGNQCLDDNDDDEVLLPVPSAADTNRPNNDKEDFVLNNKKKVSSAKLMNDGDDEIIALGDAEDSSTVLYPPPTRDSGIGLGLAASFNDDEDILDLDRFGEMDDEESWLYSTPAAKKTDDIVSWLHKDIDSLDYSTRRALATKLEFILKHKRLIENSENEENDASIAGQLKSSRTTSENGEDSPSSVTRRKTFKLDRSSIDAAATYTKPVKKQQKSIEVNQQRKLTPTLTFSIPDEPPAENELQTAVIINDNNANGSNSGRRSLDEMLKELHKQPDINPDLKDIRLLASMQEQDLRQCLQQLQLAQSHRRRTSSDRQETNGAQTKTLPPQLTPVPSTVVTTPQGNVSVASVSARPSSAGSSASLQSPRIVHSSASSDEQPDPAAIVTTPKGVHTLRHPSVGASQAEGQQPSVGLSISAQKAGGLQKSMPNLAASKSCDALKQEVAMSASTSEKGSYGDIPAAHQDTADSTPSIQKDAIGRTNIASRLPTPRSRLPTPSRNTVTASKSAIPGPKFNTPAALPKKNVPQRSAAGVSPAPKEDRWKEGCI